MPSDVEHKTHNYEWKEQDRGAWVVWVHLHKGNRQAQRKRTQRRHMGAPGEYNTGRGGPLPWEADRLHTPFCRDMGGCEARLKVSPGPRPVRSLLHFISWAAKCPKPCMCSMNVHCLDKWMHGLCKLWNYANQDIFMAIYDSLACRVTEKVMNYSDWKLDVNLALFDKINYNFYFLKW